ncbi:MAG: hypothetical protein ABI113_11115, partial [Mucilaginibacter sp.]
LISRMQFSANFYDPLKYFIFSLFCIPFFRYCLQLPPKGKKIKLSYVVIAHTVFVIIALTVRYMPLKNALVYSALAYVYISVGYLIDVFKITEKVKIFINKSGSFMGKYSYPLYITHYTVLFVFSILIHNVLVYVLVSLPVILLITYSLENWFQPNFTKYFIGTKRQVVPAEIQEDYSTLHSPQLGLNFTTQKLLQH